MNVLILVGALILTYYRPLENRDWLATLYQPSLRFLEKNLNGGKSIHSFVGWLVGALLPVAMIGGGYFVLLFVNLPLAIVAGILVLYLTLRFSHFGKRAEDIAKALRDYNIDEARTLFNAWEGNDSNHYSATQIATVSIENTLRRSHHGLFAPLFWFVILGPGGALLYRLTHLCKLEWTKEKTVNGFGQFSSDMFGWLDWLPARITAGSYAVMGDFEDAAYCWRTQAVMWSDQSLGILFASGAGALGVKLGEPLPNHGILEYRPELGLGDPADADYLQSSVGLVWRVLIMMVGLLVLLTFAHWLGN